MANLSYKTRIGVNAKGMQKVWFCAHPDDYAVFLDKTANSILSIINSAVWFDSEPKAKYSLQALEEDLSLMKLFVMPVTERLLTTKNRALDVEFLIAKKYNIPILPILEDEGLATLFNEKCGNLQYLCPTKNDVTVASFKEKLSDFIFSVLVSDDLIQKVKDAFDAYIFLSYRKKDRAYAQELMRLIHKNDFCRDIAIWYDEFLIPGENFDSAITSAMEKSCLFTMVVTPNVLEDDNYVLKTEYPIAKALGKKILPAEMQKTNEDELKQKYPNIPPLSYADDKDLLSKNLKQYFSGVAKKEQSSSPTHKFFIGLAYLGGIDVEIDKPRAISLIKEASNEGLIEATKKLVSLYRYGEGVAEDGDLLNFYKDRLIEQTQKAYHESYKEEALDDFIKSVCLVAASFIDDYNFDKANSLYFLAKNECETAPDFLKEIVKPHLARILNLISKCYLKLSLYSNACNYIQESLKILRQSKSDLSNYLTKLNIATSYVDLASIQQNMYDSKSALKSAKSAEDILLEVEEIIDKDKCPPSGIAYCYSVLASVMLSQYKFKDALNYAKKALQWDAKLSPYLHPAKALENEVVDNFLLYSIYLSLNESDSAKEYLLKSYELTKEFFDKDKSVHAEEYLAVAIARIGKFYMGEGSYKKAEDLLNKSFGILQSIVNRVNSKFSVSWQGTILGYFCLLYEKISQKDLADNYYLKQIEHYESAVKRIKDVYFIQSLATAYNSYAWALSRLNQNKKALDYHEKSAKTYYLAYEKTHNQATLKTSARVYNVLADLAVKEDCLQTAKSAYEKALDCYVNIYEKNKLEFNQVIKTASYLEDKGSKEFLIICNLLISCYATELLSSNLDNLDLLNKKKIAEDKLNSFDFDKEFLSACDKAIDYFSDKKELTAKKFAVLLSIFVGDNVLSEDKNGYYQNAKRHLKYLIEEEPNKKEYLLQDEELDKKIKQASKTQKSSEKSDFDDIDIEAIINEVFS